jgi:hypothetical protein
VRPGPGPAVTAAWRLENLSGTATLALVVEVDLSDADRDAIAAAAVDAADAAIAARYDESDGWLIAVCEDCGTLSPPYLHPGEAEHLAGVHDQVHHRGAATAQVTR